MIFRCCFLFSFNFLSTSSTLSFMYVYTIWRWILVGRSHIRTGMIAVLRGTRESVSIGSSVDTTCFSFPFPFRSVRVPIAGHPRTYSGIMRWDTRIWSWNIYPVQVSFNRDARSWTIRKIYLDPIFQASERFTSKTQRVSDVSRASAEYRWKVWESVDNVVVKFVRCYRRERERKIARFLNTSQQRIRETDTSGDEKPAAMSPFLFFLIEHVALRDRIKWKKRGGREWGEGNLYLFVWSIYTRYVVQYK